MTALDALQTTLAGEHAAVYVCGALGGRTSQSATPVLYAALGTAYAAHRSQRDQLTATVRDLGGDPVAADVAYDVPAPLDTPDDVAAAAAELEHRCATTYAALVAQTVGDQRRWAIVALTSAAVRRTGLAGDPDVFPGAADLAP